MIYEILDFFFVLFHSLLILFNLFGWIWKKTRLWNLVTLLLTGGSWFILGIFYGIGYCPLTDWHFSVLDKLGERNLPSSYIEYLSERLTGANFQTSLVNILTMIGFFLALIISLWLNILESRKKRRNKRS